jgi:hypothetical protein
MRNICEIEAEMYRLKYSATCIVSDYSAGRGSAGGASCWAGVVYADTCGKDKWTLGDTEIISLKLFPLITAIA